MAAPGDLDSICLKNLFFEDRKTRVRTTSQQISVGEAIYSLSQISDVSVSRLPARADRHSTYLPYVVAFGVGALWFIDLALIMTGLVALLAVTFNQVCPIYYLNVVLQGTKTTILVSAKRDYLENLRAIILDAA